MSSKAIVKTITFLTFAAVVAVPLFYQRYGVYPYTWAKSLLLQTVIEFILAFWLVLVFKDNRYKPQWDLFTKLLAVFAAALLLTAILGEDPWRSFWSTYDRAFGVFTILHLAGFALVLRSLWRELPWRQIFYASVVAAVVAGALALLQLKINNLLLEETVSGRPGSTFGNPTFLAGYLLFNIFLGLYLLFDRLRAGMRLIKFLSLGTILLAVATGLMAFVLFFTETRGDILGFGTALFALLVSFAFRPPSTNFSWVNNRRLYVAAAIFLIFSGAVFWFTRGSYFWSGVPGLSRFQEISLESDSLQPRFIAARAAWRGFLENPLLGVGWDNFNLVFNEYYDPRSLRSGYQETRFDKPHNFLLEDLVAGGLLLALSRLALFFFFVRAAWKMRDWLLGHILIAVLIGYFVRNLFFFDTLSTALMFYMFLGYVAGYGESERADKAYNEKSAINPRVSKAGFLAAAIAAAALTYFVNLLPAVASYRHYWAFTYIAKGDIERAAESFRSALSIKQPYRWNLVRDYAAAMADSYFYSQAATPRDAVLGAIEEMEKVAAEHPRDAYNHYALVDMYNQVSDIDLERFLPAAERQAAIALKLSPNRQQVLLSLAKTKSLQGDNEAAKELARRAVALDDGVADSHFYYGLLSFVQKDYETGYQEIKKALSLGKKWKRFYEPLSAANFFADYGKIEEALQLYKQANELDPEDLEVQIKIGVASYFVGDILSARNWLERAGRNFNFRESPAFAELQPILEELGIAY